MTGRPAISALLVTLFVSAAVPARAQSVPEGQSCGGLLCDMGVFGHKTAPAASPPPVAPLATAPLPKAAAAVPPEPEAVEPKTRILRKKKRVAKAAPAQVAAPAPVAAAPVAPPAAAPAQPQAAAQSAPSILNPYAMPQSTTYRFRPIYQ